MPLLSASEMSALVRSGETTATALAEAHLARIAELQPRLNAFATCDPELVLAQAHARDAQQGARGPLHGVPLSIRSSRAVAGLPLEAGSPLLRGNIAQEDAVCVQRLRHAGAVILGNTNLPEMLMAYESDNDLHGRVNHPLDPERTPGGSSGGESAAVSSGMSAAGVGSDSGGSVRVPAHFTGICSLKATPGRIPGAGHLPPCIGPFSILGAIGPMARTIEDVSLLFDVLSGQDAADPASAPIRPGKWTAEELKR